MFGEGLRSTSRAGAERRIGELLDDVFLKAAVSALVGINRHSSGLCLLERFQMGKTIGETVFKWWPNQTHKKPNYSFFATHHYTNSMMMQGHALAPASSRAQKGMSSSISDRLVAGLRCALPEEPEAAGALNDCAVCEAP